MEPVRDRFVLQEEEARRLASEFGHPLYVVDEAFFRARIRRYRTAFATAAKDWELTYASKANSCLAILAIAAQEGCRIDCASEGELKAAILAGVPPSRIHLHGCCKSEAEIRFAIIQSVSQIVVDNKEELELLASLGLTLPDLLLRIAPGVDPKTNVKMATGQADTKFGFCMADGAAERAALFCIEHGLPLVGFHCHVGSQLMEPSAQLKGARALARFAVRLHAECGLKVRVINAGGGMGVPYKEEDTPLAIEDYCRLLVQGIEEELTGSGISPQIVQEPGRSLIAPAGLTLYEVGAVKKAVFEGGERTYACVHGGLADNPRPALYGAHYPLVHVSCDGRKTLETGTFTVSGRHCETDLLFADVSLPRDLKKGDLIQVLCTGAYNSAMASQYNRYPRPATLLKRLDGSYQVVQAADTWLEMFARERLPSDLSHPLDTLN